jgi:MerR family transcriptional regulator, thiopeptide resistance regulator
MLVSIGKVAAAARVSVRTLHLYDEIGLLRPAARGAGGRRRYAPEATDRLRRITALRSLGFSLDAIGDLLDGRAHDTVAVVREHLERVRQRVEEGQALAARLERIAASSPPSVDAIIDSLQEANMYERYFTQEQLDGVRARARNIPSAEEWRDAWAMLRTLFDEGTDPRDAKLRVPLAHLDALLARVTGGDAGVVAGIRQLWRENRASIGPTYGIDEGLEIWLAKARRAG